MACQSIPRLVSSHQSDVALKRKPDTKDLMEEYSSCVLVADEYIPKSHRFVYDTAKAVKVAVMKTKQMPKLLSFLNRHTQSKNYVTEYLVDASVLLHKHFVNL